MRRDVVTVRDAQQLPGLDFDRNQDRGQRRAESLVPDAEDDVLHERVDAGAADDAASVQGLDGRGDGGIGYQDHQVDRDQVDVVGKVIGLEFLARSGEQRRVELIPALAEQLARVCAEPPGAARGAHDISEFQDSIVPVMSAARKPASERRRAFARTGRGEDVHASSAGAGQDRGRAARIRLAEAGLAAGPGPPASRVGAGCLRAGREKVASVAALIWSWRSRPDLHRMCGNRMLPPRTFGRLAGPPSCPFLTLLGRVVHGRIKQLKWRPVAPEPRGNQPGHAGALLLIVIN